MIIFLVLRKFFRKMTANLTAAFEKRSIIPGEKHISENLEAELKLFKVVEDCFAGLSFDQTIIFRYTYRKWLLSFFFLLEKEVGPDVIDKIVDCLENLFKKNKVELKDLGWCGDYQAQTEKVEMTGYSYRITVSFPNKSQKRLLKHTKGIVEQEPCRCLMCCYYFYQ